MDTFSSDSDPSSTSPMTCSNPTLAQRRLTDQHRFSLTSNLSSTISPRLSTSPLVKSPSSYRRGLISKSDSSSTSSMTSNIFPKPLLLARSATINKSSNIQSHHSLSPNTDSDSNSSYSHSHSNSLPHLLSPNSNDFFNSKSLKSRLSNILENPITRQKFHTFLQNRFCEENLELYIDVKKYQLQWESNQWNSSDDGDSSIMRVAFHIYGQYLRESSHKAVNVPKDLLINVENRLFPNNGIPKNLPRDLFDDVQQQCFYLMAHGNLREFLKFIHQDEQKNSLDVESLDDINNRRSSSVLSVGTSSNSLDIPSSSSSLPPPFLRHKSTPSISSQYSSSSSLAFSIPRSRASNRSKGTFTRESNSILSDDEGYASTIVTNTRPPSTFGSQCYQFNYDEHSANLEQLSEELIEEEDEEEEDEEEEELQEEQEQEINDDDDSDDETKADEDSPTYISKKINQDIEETIHPMRIKNHSKNSHRHKSIKSPTSSEHYSQSTPSLLDTDRIKPSPSSLSKSVTSFHSCSSSIASSSNPLPPIPSLPEIFRKAKKFATGMKKRPIIQKDSIKSHKSNQSISTVGSIAKPVKVFNVLTGDYKYVYQ